MEADAALARLCSCSSSLTPHGICVYSSGAAILKVLALGCAILLSLARGLLPFLTLGFCGSLLPPTRNANSFLGTDSTQTLAVTPNASVYSAPYCARVIGKRPKFFFVSLQLSSC